MLKIVTFWKKMHASEPIWLPSSHIEKKIKKISHIVYTKIELFWLEMIILSYYRFTPANSTPICGAYTINFGASWHWSKAQNTHYLGLMVVYDHNYEVSIIYIVPNMWGKYLFIRLINTNGLVALLFVNLITQLVKV